VLAAWPTEPASEIDKLTLAARAFGLATSVCDDAQLHSALDKLGRPALGQLLALIDDIRTWVADKFEA
jgi:hypothetical protein